MGRLSKAHRAASPDESKKIQQLREELPRRTIEQALRDAAAGLSPRNPHNDPEILKAEALIANDIFNAHLRPTLRIAIGAPHYIEGPEKAISRAAKKKGGVYGDNCDWARHSNLLKDMGMIEKASDLLSQRGVLTLRGPGNLPLEFYLVDVDNTYIENVAKKPGLRMMNTKILVPIPLKDDKYTYHILELRSYLAASQPAMDASEEEYKEYRTAYDLAKAFYAASETARDPHTIKRLNIEYKRAANNAAAHLAERTRICLEDAEEHGANSLLGYKPNIDASLPKGASFTTFESYLDKKYPADAAEESKVVESARNLALA